MALERRLCVLDRRRIMPQQGWEASAREASRKVEEHYDKLKEMHG